MKGLIVIERQPEEWLGVGEFVPATLEQMADMVDGRVSYISRTQLNQLKSVAQVRIAYTPVQVMPVDENTTTVRFLGIGEAYTDCVQVDSDSLYAISDIDEMFYEVIEGAFAHWLSLLEIQATVGHHRFEINDDIKRQLISTKPIGVCYEVIDDQAVMTFHFLAIVDQQLEPECFPEFYGGCNCVFENKSDEISEMCEDFTTEVIVSHNALLFKHLASINMIKKLSLLNL